MKTLGTYLGVALVVALAFFGYQRYGAWQTAKLARWRADSARVAVQAAEAGRLAAIASLKADTVKLRYTVYRDRVIASGTATLRDTATFAMCDALVVSCTALHAADSVEKASLRAELAVARARPSDAPRRLAFRAGALYDVLSAAPLFRADAIFRVLGPVALGAEGEVAIPPASRCVPGGAECRVQFGARLGVWYTF